MTQQETEKFAQGSAEGSSAAMAYEEKNAELLRKQKTNKRERLENE